MKYIKIMSMIAFIGIYMAGCSQGRPKKLHLLYKRKQRYQRRRTGKRQEQEKNEESQAIQTNEQVEHKQEEVSSDEKKEETTPVRPAEQPVQNNEQK